MSQQVIVSGLDPTAYATISGAQLLQMFSLATFATSVGGVITTVDSAGTPSVPAGGTDTTLQNYVWIRVSATSTQAYVWNPLISSNATYLKWQPMLQAALGVNNVTGGIYGNIALSTITPDNISSVQGSQIAGQLSSSASANLVTNATAAGGVLSGTFSTLAFVANTMAINILTVTSATTKAVPLAADQTVLFDSAAANVGKITTLADIKAAIFPSFQTSNSGVLTTGAQLVLSGQAHGLTSPVRAECFIICTTNDGTFVVGDIIPVSSLGHYQHGTAATDVYEAIHCVFNATLVYIVSNIGASNGAGITVVKRDGSAVYQLTLGSWKAYAIVYAY